MPMTRAEYLSFAGTDDAFAAHRRYYAQFVTDETRAAVQRVFGLAELLSAAEADSQFFNGIMLPRWFYATVRLPFDRALFAEMDRGGVSQADLVCVAKEAARQIVEAPRADAYTVVVDSNLRTFIKEAGYGFIAVIDRRGGGVRVRPQNKGCDMAQSTLDDIARSLGLLGADNA